MDLIEINNIRKEYNKKIVLEINHLTFDKNEIIGLVGNNGAGKTTLFRILVDLIKPTSGQVHINKINIQEDEQWKKITASFMGEEFLVDFLTPEEYFFLISKLKNNTASQLFSRLQIFNNFFRGEILEQKKQIKFFSKGNIQKIGIASCFIQNPQIIILDEPFANIDPSSRLILEEIIKDYNRENSCTFIISSHDLSNIYNIATRFLIMDKGKIVKDILKDECNFETLINHFK